MKGCNDIRKLIDEAHKPDLLSFEAAEHIGRCGECGRFASERAALRKLVASSGRVSAPMNFDAMLKSRLAEAKTRRAFWWLNTPGYVRLGAATAGLVVMFFGAQYAGLFSDHSMQTDRAQRGPTVSAPGPTAPGVPRELPPPATVVTAGADRAAVYASGKPSRVRRAFVGVGERIAPDGYLAAEDGGVVLVRSESGGPDVAMPTVSVGAQPLVYVGASQRAARTVGTSF